MVGKQGMATLMLNKPYHFVWLFFYCKELFSYLFSVNFYYHLYSILIYAGAYEQLFRKILQTLPHQHSVIVETWFP